MNRDSNEVLPSALSTIYVAHKSSGEAWH
ncbi:unnamed protein product, partial [Rotaria sp. Silwood1]